MKLHFVFPAIVAAALLVGCETPRQTATRIVGPGTKRIYVATYDQTWRAAVAAMRQSDLTILTTDQTTGYIEARRTSYSRPRDENIGIWLRTIAPMQTEVEVIDRQVGPPLLSLLDRELAIHNDIALFLTREMPAVGAAPREVIVERGNGGTTIVVPPSSGQKVIIPPAASTTDEVTREYQRQLDTLRLRQQTGERALAAEVDETKRDMLRREVDRLREDIKFQERRLRDLERELK